MRRDFYVYEHLRISDGKPFYIGKGVKSRASNTTHRSEWWKRIHAKHGREVRYIKKGMPEACAISLEKVMIAVRGRRLLANLSDGGEGVSNPTEHNRRVKANALSFRNSPISDRKRYDFYHPSFGKVTSTKFHLRSAFDLQSTHISRLCSGKTTYLKGWTLLHNKGATGKKAGPNKATKKAVFSFVHDDGRVWRGNLHDFRKEFSANIGSTWRLVRGLKLRHKGWKLA